MALEKQIVPLPLAQGVDLGVANNLRSPESLSSGVNCEHLVSGEIVKRNGFVPTAGTPASTPITSIPVPSSLVVPNNLTDVNGLQFLSSTGSLNYIYQDGKIAPRIRKVTATLDTLLGTSTGFINYDIDYTGSSILVAVTMTGGSEVRAYQFDTSLNLIPAASAPYYSVTGLTNASVKVVAGRIFVYQSTGSIRIYSSSLTFSGTSLTVGGGNSWDVCEWSNGGFAVLYDNGSNMVLGLYASSTSLTTSTTFANTNVTRACVFPQTLGSSIIAFIARSTGNKLTAFKYNGSLVLQGTADQSYGSNVVYNITGIAPAGISSILFAVEYGTSTATDVHERGVRCLSVAASYSGTTTMNLYGDNLIRLGLASKPVQTASGEYPYFLVSHQSIDSFNLQNCYAMLQFGDPNAVSFLGFVGRYGYGLAENFMSRRSTANNVLPNLGTVSSSLRLGAVLTRSDSSLTTTAASSIFNLSLMQIASDSYFQGSKPVRFGGYTVAASNGIYLADSVGLNELGVHLYPDKLVVTNGGAGSIPNGTYSYVAVVEVFDNNGNLLESSTSEPTSITNSSGNSTFTIQCYGIGLISWVNARVSFYRTTAGGSIYYLVTTASTLNSPSFTVSDNTTDATLQTQKILYTTGGVAENIAPPNANFVAAVKNRLWTFEQGSLDTLWFTKELREGQVPQFSDLLTINVGRQYGALKGVAALDDKILMFKEFCVSVVVGDGPSDNLVGGWSSPAVIAQNVGLISARSLVETPQGVYFQSQEGIYIIDKGMNAQFVGRPIYKNDGTVISSAYDPVKNAVFFLTTTKLWVFYATTGSWFEWTVTNPIDVVYEAGVLYLITTTKILKLTANVWQDDSSNYQQLIRLGQFQAAGIQGYQRVYRMLATGRSLADEAGTVTVKNYINASPTATDTLTIAQTSLVSSGKMSLEVRPSIQKCESMQLEISHTANNSGLTINAVTAEVGAIPGAGRRVSTGRAV